MTLVIDEVYRTPNGIPKRIRITLFDYSGAPTVSYYLDRNIGRPLIKDWDNVKAGTRIILMPIME